MTVNSDARNKQVALARIKRLASSGLPLEPFVRSALELFNQAVIASPHCGIHVGTTNSNAYIFSTDEVEKIIPAHNHYFVESPPSISGAKFKINLDALKYLLPTRTVWRQDEAFSHSLDRAEGYNEAYRPLGWHHCIAVVFHESQNYEGTFGIWRSIDQKPFNQDDTKFLLAAAPHVTHGLKVARLQSRTSDTNSGFSPLPG